MTGQATAAQQARLQLGAQRTHGVLGVDDLRVTQLGGGAGNGVAIAAGGYIAEGREEPAQGHYSEHMTTADELTDAFAGNTSGSTRYDMVVVRVEDPTVEGTSWSHDPATEAISYLRVIPNVGPNARTLPGGQTGEPLARVAIPTGVATPTVTNAMITDLRTLANRKTPERQVVMTVPAGSTDLTSGAYVEWPPSSLSVDVPEWATHAALIVSLSQVQVWSGNFVGMLRSRLGSLSSSELGVDLDAPTSTAYRTGFVVGGAWKLPAGMAGTTQTVKLEGKKTSGTGKIRSAGATHLIFDVEFTEKI